MSGAADPTPVGLPDLEGLAGSVAAHVAAMMRG